MTYCTNCGKENSKKICPHCGVKRNATHKFCEWCGSEINEIASICTNCGENVKEGVSSKVKGLLKFAIIALTAFLTLVCAIVSAAPIIPMLCFIIAIAALLPATKKLLRTHTIGKKGLRAILNFAKNILVAVLIIAGFTCMLNGPQKEHTHEFDPVRAKDSAVYFFHQDVNLKDESSFVLNKYEWKIEKEPYQGDENLEVVHITLDYSAKNGFGGMGRDTYYVKMVFDKTTGQYSKLSSRK